MRTDEFRQRLLAGTAPPSEPRAPEKETFISYDGLREHGVPFTRVHLRRLIAKGLFPAPAQLSPNRIGWKLSEIAAWKASRPIAPTPRDAA